MEELALKIVKIFIALCSFLLVQCGHTTSSYTSDNGYGIYLLEDTSLTTIEVKTRNIDSLNVQLEPIINLKDIISYHWSSHKIVLQNDALKRIELLEKKNISTYGLPFIVIVRDERIYLGTITPSYSSYWHAELPSIYIAPIFELKINRALDEYEDLRNDPRIYNILLENDKIRK